MRFKGLLLIISITIAFTACTKNSTKSIKISNSTDSLAYAIGVLNYNALTQQDLELDALKIAKGMIEAGEGVAIFDEMAARGYYSDYMRNLEEVKMSESYKGNIEESSEFLAQNSLNTDVIVTESGLQYKVLKPAEGAMPSADSRVKVHYTGTLIDGTVFDSSFDHDPPAPVEFDLSDLIMGWREGLQLMTVGSSYMFYIPADLAWGSRGAGQDIPPFAAVIFEVELLEIVN